MPNHCENRLVVVGKKDDIQAFTQKVLNKNDEGCLGLDFNTIVPMSLEMQRAIQDDVQSAKQYLSCFGDNPLKENEHFLVSQQVDLAPVYQKLGDEVTVEQAVDLLLEQGDIRLSVGLALDTAKKVLEGDIDDDWYHWRVRNWGTKWNAYYQTITSGNREQVFTERSNGLVEFSINFSTAWTPPEQWYRTMMATYPELSFSAYYFEPGCWFGGLYESDDEGEMMVFPCESEEELKDLAVNTMGYDEDFFEEIA